jgi:hypothetical protein
MGLIPVTKLNIHKKQKTPFQLRKKGLIYVYGTAKGVRRLKHHLLIKFFMMLLLFCSSLLFVSMSHLHHPTDQGNMIAVESEAIIGLVTLGEEEQKHIDFFSTSGTAIIVLVTAITLFLYGQLSTQRQILKPFLYAVYYQSSYFSKDHLFKPTLFA